MGPQRTGKAGHKGFYYHFLDMQEGRRYDSWVELSSVDTALLMMGVLFAQSYYDGDDPREKEIRQIADTLYKKVDWPWLQQRAPLISMGWFPESGFIDHDWMGYNEAMMVYILALGSPTHPVSPDAWTVWTRTYDNDWGVYQGQEYLSFGPLFGHQYSHVWIDFRDIQTRTWRARQHLFPQQLLGRAGPARVRHRQPDAVEGLWRERVGPDRQRWPAEHHAGVPRRTAPVPPLPRAAPACARTSMTAPLPRLRRSPRWCSRPSR